MKRLNVVLVFGVVVLGGLIMLGVGWNAVGRLGVSVRRLLVSSKLRVSVNTTCSIA